MKPGGKIFVDGTCSTLELKNGQKTKSGLTYLKHGMLTSTFVV